MDYSKTCKVCGNVYKYCVYCREFDNQPKWRMLFDTDNCRKIFHAVSDYLTGEINEDQAKEILVKCDIANKNKFNDNVKKVLSELFSEDKKETVKIIPEKKVSSRNKKVSD